ncbi:GAF and ANTAR domain-containing protein [Jiangella asiatica]|uniref:ANTAR domain-containing protein n=1 Tax=Jiangella asiatica TaxID=2530372 RepID=A0A4R5DV42_9ACTN|nr:GAF and ANTAR domain-containing protein [Jiangella asiatica]TDE16021.1 ANTAR domain-containing protein [Jiangella asiatica]
MDHMDRSDLAQLALELHDEPDVEQTLDRLIEYARDTTGCDEAGVLFLHGGGRIETVAITGPKVATSDRLQTELREGPCLEALQNNESFVVTDTTLEKRWPAWARGVTELGLRSVIGVRLSTLRDIHGALDLYSATPGFFDEDDLEVADIFGRHASVALAAAREQHGLRQAIGTRQLIGQAQGMLMERFDLDADRAFALLRRYSQHKNVKLRNVAQQVIDTRQLPGD